VLATCLKTSPSRYSRLLLFPRAYVFTKRKRTRATRAGTGTGGGKDARSFDSAAFLPIRQTFDSFTWEPQNSSWWLSQSSLLPDPLPSSLVKRVWVSGTCSEASMPPRYIPSAGSRSRVFLTSAKSQRATPLRWIP